MSRSFIEIGEGSPLSAMNLEKMDMMAQMSCYMSNTPVAFDVESEDGFQKVFTEVASKDAAVKLVRNLKRYPIQYVRWERQEEWKLIYHIATVEEERRTVAGEWRRFRLKFPEFGMSATVKFDDSEESPVQFVYVAAEEAKIYVIVGVES